MSSTTGHSKLLAKGYKDLLRLKYDLECLLDFDCDKFSDIDLMGTAKSWIENGVLRITINDYLPRNNFVTSDVYNSWIGIIAKTLIDKNIHFDRALCVIINYLPRDGWDVDNRGYGIIINALRYAGIIKDDTFRHLAFMVVGEVDKDNPRTEIYVGNFPEDVKSFTSTILNCTCIEGKIIL